MRNEMEKPSEFVRSIVRPIISIYLIIFTTSFLAWLTANNMPLPAYFQWLVWITTGTIVWYFGQREYFKRKEQVK